MRNDKTVYISMYINYCYDYRRCIRLDDRQTANVKSVYFRRSNFKLDFRSNVNMKAFEDIKLKCIGTVESLERKFLVRQRELFI